MHRSLALPLALALGLAASAQAGDVESRVAATQAALQEFGATLQGEMQAAMQRGGPTEAIAVCNQRAPEIASLISEQTGWAVGRTSLKLRNPNNAPDDWERAVLEDFDARRAAGTPPAELVHYEVVTEGDQSVFRFMRAIPTGGVCLTCHGDAIPEGVQHALERMYPEDQARGYTEGQVRGAFTVIQRM
jgi:ketosteroid isomerase-like protein